MNNVSQTEAVRGHIGRLRALATTLENEAERFEKELIELRADTIPAPPPDDARAALLRRVSKESERLCAAALRGEFPCVACSAAGPHANAGAGDDVAFVCIGCGRSLGDNEIKLAVFATLAGIAAATQTGG